METKLNLGSGENYLEGYINIDNDNNMKADIYENFVDNISYEDNYVD